MFAYTVHELWEARPNGPIGFCINNKHKGPSQSGLKLPLSTLDFRFLAQKQAFLLKKNPQGLVEFGGSGLAPPH